MTGSRLGLMPGPSTGNHVPSCFCNRLLEALERIDHMLTFAANRPEYLRRSGGKFFIKKKTLNRAQYPEAEYPLQKLIDDLKRYRECYEFSRFLRASQFVGRRMGRIIKKHINTLKNIKCSQTPKSWDNRKRY